MGLLSLFVLMSHRSRAHIIRPTIGKPGSGRPVTSAGEHSMTWHWRLKASALQRALLTRRSCEQITPVITKNLLKKSPLLEDFLAVVVSFHCNQLILWATVVVDRGAQPFWARACFNVQWWTKCAV